MKPDALTEYRVGERVPGTDWVMRGIVGQGGMGVVLEVSKGRNLRAAMKILRPAYARSPEFESRFVEEVEVLARLRHPNIVEVWDCGVLSNGCPFLLMELLRGRTIRAIARDKATHFTAETVWKIVGQICAGLSHAHQDKPPVVHRDVKPENVFLHGRGHVESKVKVLDFGIAKVLSDTRAVEQVAGTPRYIAPEVLRQEPISPRVDLYALAVLVYELLTQAFPWSVDVQSAEAVSEAHLKRAPTPPSHWKPWIPRSVDACLLQALSKNPERRQRTVAEFYEQLAELQGVDDGSAKFQTDAPTVPTVETLARGPLAALEATRPEVDSRARERSPAGQGGWLAMARSRLHSGPEPVPAGASEPGGDAIHVTTASWVAPPERPLEPDDCVLEAAGELSVADSASEREGALSTPLTGTSSPRAPRSARASVAARVFGVAMIVAMGAWGGWSVWRAAPARALFAKLAGAPSASAPAAVSVMNSSADTVTWPTEVASSRPAVASTVRAEPETRPLAIAAAPIAADAGARRAGLAPRPTALGRRPKPAATNLDDVIFGPEDMPVSAGSQAPNSPPSIAPTGLDGARPGLAGPRAP